MKKELIKNFKLHKLKDERGTAMILSYLVLTVLFTLSAGYALSNVTELSTANRFHNSAQAFWTAEAGVQRFIQNNNLLNGGPTTLTIGGATVFLSKNDTDPQTRVLTAVATSKGITRSIEVEFTANPPGIFENTLASGGNIDISGFLAGVGADGVSKIGGNLVTSGLAGSSIDSLTESAALADSTLVYPDSDVNGTSDEFTDFKQFNQDLLATYHPDDVVWVTQDADYTIIPNAALIGKKILYVEGSAPGTGNVDIVFDSTWAADQNLTVISTGDVNYIQPLSSPSSNSQLNTISWNNYNEAAILISAHAGTTYAHDEANFDAIFSLSYTDGNVIANDVIDFDLILLVWKHFDYENPLDAGGEVPPGFEGLLSGSTSGYQSTPSAWREI